MNIADAKIGGSVGAVGASAGIAGYWDKNDDSLNLSVSGDLATVLGLKGDVGMKFVCDGLFDWVFEGEQGSAKSKTVIKEGGWGHLIWMYYYFSWRLIS
ncbi:hypothetical protein [Erwinia sp. E_sp_B04_7]|uniref:hypothetical protein n=1 Tax=unclassified Erwinia TaxID=2622719 RepID=UPI0030CEF9FF